MQNTPREFSITLSGSCPFSLSKATFLTRHFSSDWPNLWPLSDIIFSAGLTLWLTAVVSSMIEASEDLISWLSVYTRISMDNIPFDISLDEVLNVFSRLCSFGKILFFLSRKFKSQYSVTHSLRLSLTLCFVLAMNWKINCRFSTPQRKQLYFDIFSSGKQDGTAICWHPLNLLAPSYTTASIRRAFSLIKSFIRFFCKISPQTASSMQHVSTLILSYSSHLLFPLVQFTL